MYTGKRFRLGEAVLGIERVNGRHLAVPIPSGETVVVLSGPKPSDMRLVDVQWGERRSRSRSPRIFKLAGRNSNRVERTALLPERRLRSIAAAGVQPHILRIDHSIRPEYEKTARPFGCAARRRSPAHHPSWLYRIIRS